MKQCNLTYYYLAIQYCSRLSQWYKVIQAIIKYHTIIIKNHRLQKIEIKKGQTLAKKIKRSQDERHK